MFDRGGENEQKEQNQVMEEFSKATYADLASGENTTVIGRAWNMSGSIFLCTGSQIRTPGVSLRSSRTACGVPVLGVADLEKRKIADNRRRRVRQNKTTPGNQL